MRKKKTKKKVKLKNILIILGGIGFFVLVFLWYKTLNIKNIYVIGNKVLEEQEILDLSGLLYYPKIYEVSPKKIEKDLLENPLIIKAHVSKTLFGKIEIKIEEDRVLLKLNNNHYLTSQNKEIELDKTMLGLPYLMNDCPDQKENLLKKLNLIHEDILKHVSQIEYKPNDLDKERFLLYMNDGNYVYITLSKIELLNSYNEIYPTLDNKKGILYLDSGNHFEIKKSN